jgi:hypothetical protein
MASPQYFDAFFEDLAHKKHDLANDQIEIALVAAANAPSLSADGVLADLTEIAYTYCNARTLTTSSSGQTSGVYKLVCADHSIIATGGGVGPFRYVVVFNQGAANDELILMFDYGSDITIPDGESLDLDLDQTNGLINLQVAP